MVVPDKPQVEI